jgi:hypothetical protein
VQARGAGGHDYARELVLLDIVLDLLLARGGAHVLVVVHVSHVHEGLCILLDCRDIYRSRNIGTAVADVDADPGVLPQ